MGNKLSKKAASPASKPSPTRSKHPASSQEVSKPAMEPPKSLKSSEQDVPTKVVDNKQGEDDGLKFEDENNMAEMADRGEYHNLVDILFVLDATGSMSWCMDQMKKTVKKIIKKFSDKQYNIKFAIEVYRDHPPQEYSYIEKHFDLMNENKILQIIDKECEVGGGGDTPEAVMDGLFHGIKKTSWRVSTDGKTKSKRFLFHGCDAPPHGKEYGSISSDPSWNTKGCPCGITREQIRDLLFEHNVDYSLIKCGSSVETMEKLFKQCFSERFKRSMEIKQKARKKHKRSKKAPAIATSDLSAAEEDECYDDYEEERMPEIACMRAMHSGEFAEDLSLEMARPAMKMRALPKMKKEKKQKESRKMSESQSGSDSDEGGKCRSMASLVLSEVESGVDDYFGDDIKKKDKEEKESKEKVEEKPISSEAEKKE